MSVRVPAIAGFLICLNSLTFGFDRADTHSQQVGRDRLSERGLLNSGYRETADLSSGSASWIVSESVAPSRFKQRSPAARSQADCISIVWSLMT